MRCWTVALSAGLAASAAVRGGEHATLVPGPDMVEAEGLVPLTINVSAHLVTTPGGKQLSDEALDGQMSILNRSFEPHNISFVLVETERITHALWGAGIDDMRMMWDHNRGDARTLNLYFVERFSKGRKQGYGSSAYGPHRIPQDEMAYKVDGAIVAAHTVPGGPGWDAASGDSRATVWAAAYWLGLSDPFSRDCHGKGGMLDDGPAARANASLTLSNGTANAGDGGACGAEITPGQAQLMHQQWRTLRAPHRVPAGPPLRPLAAHEAAGKLPRYSRPTSWLAAIVLCLPHEAQEVREARESHCGTFVYCYFGTWKAAGTGEAYASNNTWTECEDARAPPLADEEVRRRRRRASPVDGDVLAPPTFWT